MAEIRIIRDYPSPRAQVWRALTDPGLVPRWTSTGRGGRPVGFTPVAGTQFRFVGKPVPGWRGYVDCEVLQVRAPELLRYSWQGEDNGSVTEVSYQLDEVAGGTRFTYLHTGFRGVEGFVMARLVLGPVRRKMLDVGLPAVLSDLDAERQQTAPG